MKTTRSIFATGLALIAVVLLAGCSSVQASADRTDEFVAAGQECTGSWWLGEVRDGTSIVAKEVAEEALSTAEVSSDHLDAATSLLDLSKTDVERKSVTPVDFESEAYMLAVTLQVKDALDQAGYPDTDRVIEIWSERHCS